MGKKILFTAAGTHDPVTLDRNDETKCNDGSILAICRNVEPDIVYLYLSKELNVLEKNDFIFSKAINKLNPNIEVKLIETEDESNVANFDYFIDKFRKELIKI